MLCGSYTYNECAYGMELALNLQFTVLCAHTSAAVPPCTARNLQLCPISTLQRSASLTSNARLVRRGCNVVQRGKLLPTDISGYACFGDTLVPA